MRDSYVVNHIMAEYYNKKKYERKLMRQNCKKIKCSECGYFNKCYGDGSENYESRN